MYTIKRILLIASLLSSHLYAMERNTHKIMLLQNHATLAHLKIKNLFATLLYQDPYIADRAYFDLCIDSISECNGQLDLLAQIGITPFGVNQEQITYDIFCVRQCVQSIRRSDQYFMALQQQAAHPRADHDAESMQASCTDYDAYKSRYTVKKLINKR